MHQQRLSRLGKRGKTTIARKKGEGEGKKRKKKHAVSHGRGGAKYAVSSYFLGG